MLRLARPYRISAQTCSEFPYCVCSATFYFSFWIPVEPVLAGIISFNVSWQTKSLLYRILKSLLVFSCPWHKIRDLPFLRMGVSWGSSFPGNFPVFQPINGRIPPTFFFSPYPPFFQSLSQSHVSWRDLATKHFFPSSPIFVFLLSFVSFSVSLWPLLDVNSAFSHSSSRQRSSSFDYLSGDVQGKWETFWFITRPWSHTEQRTFSNLSTLGFCEVSCQRVQICTADISVPYTYRWLRQDILRIRSITQYQKLTYNMYTITH